MNTEKFIKLLTKLVNDYLTEEEAYGDDVQLEINTVNWEMDIADPENDLPNCDYYPMMDLVKMSVTEPGKWVPDMDAINEVAAEYVFTE